MLDTMNNKGKHLTSFDRAFIHEGLTSSIVIAQYKNHEVIVY